jgi:TetR/AcrR family transcriptional regulator
LGTAERKQREKLRRQEAIIDAAEQVILERGFEAATMDEIADKAELSKGTLYLYFKNKTALYLAICLRGSQKLNSRFVKVLSMDKPGIELIRILGETYLNFVRENPIYFHAFSYYESIQDQDFLKKNKMAQLCEDNSREAMAYITRTLQIGMQDGTIDDRYDPKELAVMIWASSRGIVQVAYLKSMGHHFKVIDDIDLDVESMFESFIQLLQKGMSK